jgi:hypothetical protein
LGVVSLSSQISVHGPCLVLRALKSRLTGLGENGSTSKGDGLPGDVHHLGHHKVSLSYGNRGLAANGYEERFLGSGTTLHRDFDHDLWTPALLILLELRKSHKTMRAASASLRLRREGVQDLEAVGGRRTFVFAVATRPERNPPLFPGAERYFTDQRSCKETAQPHKLHVCCGKFSPFGY